MIIVVIMISVIVMVRAITCASLWSTTSWSSRCLYSFGCIMDNTVETHDTTAWFQRSMLLVIGPDATITEVAIHRYRFIYVAYYTSENSLPLSKDCMVLRLLCVVFCFSVRTNRTTDGRRPSLVLASAPPRKFRNFPACL
jgi:hypothetical protein